MLEEFLDHLRGELPGARAAMLVGVDGVIVAGGGADRKLPWELIVAAHAELVRKASTLYREVGLLAPSELVLGSGSVTLLFRAVTEEYGLLLALDPGSSVGRARHALRKAAWDIHPELEA